MLQKYHNVIPRITLAIIWLWHGLIPKLIFRSEQEVLMNDTFMPFIEKNTALISSGIMEIIYAILILIFWRSKSVIYPSILFSIGATAAIIVKLPHLMTDAFNPITLNLAVLSFSLLAIHFTPESKTDS